MKCSFLLIPSILELFSQETSIRQGAFIRQMRLFESGRLLGHLRYD